MSIQISGVANAVLDTNINELLKMVATASAVNELTLTNAATAGLPVLEATGDDANISFTLRGKGTGLVNIEDGTITATATAGAATLNKQKGVITSEALTIAAGADYTLTLTNSKISASKQVFVEVDNGTNTTAPVYKRLVTPGAGSVVIIIRNAGAVALNGTLKISFFVV